MPSSRIYFREWRKKRGFTQDQVADRLSFIDDPLIPRTGASLSRLENGKQPYSQRILEALADIYECEPHDLIGRDPTREADIIDLVNLLDERKRLQAMAVLTALAQTG